MRIENLDHYPENTVFEADVAIVGSGPAGLSIAREFIGSGLSVIILESGIEVERDDYKELLRLQSVGDPQSDRAIAFRRAYHGENCASFDQDAQPYAIRLRLFGGSAKYWGGRSATFDDTDFSSRDWMPNSGWPVAREALTPYFDRAAEVLNLGPNLYDESLWRLIGATAKIKRPPLDKTKLRSHFWQFSRSRIDPTIMMNFGEEFRALPDHDNIRTLINATVTHVNSDSTGAAFESLDVSTLGGTRARVVAKRCVLACGAIENARLLLISNRRHPEGLGNKHDVVGRYMMDHPGTRIGAFARKDIKAANYLGFYTIRDRGRLVMYTHGLTLSPEIQASEKLHNAAVYVLAEIAPDDPIEALKRLAKFRSKNFLADLWALATSMGLLIRSLGAKVFQSKLTPPAVQAFVIDALMRINPGFVVREYQSKGVPHKLDAMGLHIMIEQEADPESRVVLTEDRDALGLPRVRAQWKISDGDRRTVMRFCEILQEELPKAGMPAPVMDDWVVAKRPEEAPLVDMAHTIGTTRMSNDPKLGVVDANCAVHGVTGLYIAGSSVFPSGGHANPTLMIAALAIRVADQLKRDFALSSSSPARSREYS